MVFRNLLPRIFLKFFHFSFAICCAFASLKSALEVKTVLCIGDSITKGSGSSDLFHNYPSQLSRLLNLETSRDGIRYDVINLGLKNE